jgi:hypothetical protein
MKHLFVLTVFAVSSFSTRVHAQTNSSQTTKHLYLDVHHLGSVTAKDVEAAHKKDLAVEEKYGVQFLKYWVDEANGDVYCLASGSNADDLRKTHAEAHGLLPDKVYQVTEGQEAALKGNSSLYLDIHQVGTGVRAEDVAAAHKKDLAVQKKYGVNLIDYWFDADDGIIMCLAQAPDSAALINTHKEAHGLVPVHVSKVQQGH